MCRLSWNLGASNSWNPQGLSSPVMELLYFYLYVTIGMRIRWLVRTVESNVYFRDYNVVGVAWWTCSCYCTCIYIGKINTLKNNVTSVIKYLEPNILDEQYQYTILSLMAHLAAGVQDFERILPLECFLRFLSTASAMAWVFSLSLTTTPMSQVLLDMGSRPL